jgi:hypothetical protein
MILYHAGTLQIVLAQNWQGFGTCQDVASFAFVFDLFQLSPSKLNATKCSVIYHIAIKWPFFYQPVRVLARFVPNTRYTQLSQTATNPTNPFHS